MDINKSYSKEAIEDATSIFDAIWFLAQLFAVFFVSEYISELSLVKNEEHKSVFIFGGYLLYLVYMLLNMASFDEKKQRERAEKAEEKIKTFDEISEENGRLKEENGRLILDNDRLSKINSRGKEDNDRLDKAKRALEDKLTAVNSKATADIKEVKKLALNSSTLLRNQLDNTKNRLSAIETGLKIAGDIGSLNGRCAKATGDEKTELDRLKQEQQALMQQHLQKNMWLFEIMPSWGGIKQK